MKYSELTRLEKSAVRWLTLTRPSTWWLPLALVGLGVTYAWLDNWNFRENGTLSFFVIGAWILDKYLAAIGVNRLFRRCGVQLEPEAAAAA